MWGALLGLWPARCFPCLFLGYVSHLLYTHLRLFAPLPLQMEKAGKSKPSGAKKTPAKTGAASGRSRHWGWTLYPETFPSTSVFNPRGSPDWKAFADYLKISVEDNKMEYACFGTETCPETGKLHYQGYSQFEQPIGMKQLKEILDNNTVHCWIPKGTAAQNREYALKGLLKDDISYAGYSVEVGTFGHCNQGKQMLYNYLNYNLTRSPTGARTDLAAFADDIRDQGVVAAALQTPTYYLKYAGNAHKLEALYVSAKLDAMASAGGVTKRVDWVYGSAGLGKSRMWRWLFEGMEVYLVTEPTKRGGEQWFDGYKGQQILIIDDCLGNIPPQVLLHLADPYSGPMRQAVKGNFVNVFAKRIFITSNLTVEEAFSGPPSATITALRRRLVVTHLTKEWKPPAASNVAAGLRQQLLQATAVPLDWFNFIGDAGVEKTATQTDSDQLPARAPTAAALLAAPTSTYWQANGEPTPAIPRLRRTAETHPAMKEQTQDAKRMRLPSALHSAGSAAGPLGPIRSPLPQLPPAGSAAEAQLIAMLQTDEELTEKTFQPGRSL